ncbi:hypothetical protein KBW81_12795 [Loktanella salsilacus]|uniref:hypothetical protein n=1 Tax=Loktanella salsilacus TaxID=195913 RepID=UPI0020B8D112|nr:hypothetical protein [Loktanella salsilacus]UTH47584.1 hypothetical protein KBW81_12795 [Loktanella salsilacus]
MNYNLKDVLVWAELNNEAAEAIRSLKNIPARLGMLDVDLSSLSADQIRFEQDIAGQGYSLVSQAKNMNSNGKRADSRIRALLRRFHTDRAGTPIKDLAVRARYDALMNIIKTDEGAPGTGSRWGIGRHRRFLGLRARAEVAPEDLNQSEIDRIGREMSADKRKGLRKTVLFLNSLMGLTNEIPELREFLPAMHLNPPAGSSWARRIDWIALPNSFRATFDVAADACLAGGEDIAERMLARIEAGEDPEAIMAEADELGTSIVNGVGKPTAAREQYRLAVTWLVRAWENEGGDIETLTDIQDLLNRHTIEIAIKDQIARSNSAIDLRDPFASETLGTRLTSLTTLAKRGLEAPKVVAIIKFLRAQHYDLPRKKLGKAGNGEENLMEVDKIFAMLRQRPALASSWSNAPGCIADTARRDIEMAKLEGDKARELTALRKFAGGVAYGLQMSRPMRTACLRNARIASLGDAHSNLLRTASGDKHFTFRFAPWEIKNSRSVTVDVVGTDAEILCEWIEAWRPRMIELQDLDERNIYLFPGAALPKADEGNPIILPRGSYSPSAFLELWLDASSILGVHITPHRMRHVVALLILAVRPGNYDFVSTVLGNNEATARKHYGRDDGQAAAREARAALLAEHPDLFSQLNRRHRP